MQFCSIYDVITKFKMAENGTIFKAHTYDFFRPFNAPKELPKSKCAYIEVHTHMLPAPGVIGLHLYEKLSFSDHINAKISKANKGIGITKKLSNTLPRNSLLTLYKSFIRLHHGYCDIIYDQPNNESFCTKIKRIQYNASLAITGAIKEASRTKLYKELGLESLRFRRWSQETLYLF